MNISQTAYRFTRPPRRRARTDTIVIHHSASPDVPGSRIHQWHLDRGWIGIGYHLLVHQDGTVETGRQLDTVGAHAGPSVNGRSVGVCVLGNFENETMKEVQYKALVELIRWLRVKYGRIEVTGHRDHMNTACPGRRFPWDRLIKEIDGPVAPSLTLEVNGRQIEGIPLKAVAGTTYAQLQTETGPGWVAIRAMAELLGAKVGWDGPSQTVKLEVK